MTDYLFDWDPAKDAANQRKHGIPFRLAVQVFDDPHHYSDLDRIEGGEYRWTTIGRVEGSILLLIAHTYLGDDDQTYVRIISARRARPAERRRYGN